MHGLHGLRRVLPGQVPGPVQPGHIAEQGGPRLLRAGDPAHYLYRRELPLPQGEEVQDLRGGLQE